MYSEPFCNIFNRIIYICLIFRRDANSFIVCPKVYVSIYTLYTHDVYRPDYINPLTTKNYNFLTYVQASFSWLKTRNF